MRASSTFRYSYPICHLFLRCLKCLVQQDLLCLKILELWGTDLGALEGVIFEETFFDAAIGELHLTIAVLNAMVPLALVTRAILPVHLAIAVPLIVPVAASVVITGLPREHTHAILFIVLVVALIHVARLVIKSLLPLSFAMLETIFELTYVDAEILPFVLALTLWFTQDIGS